MHAFLRISLAATCLTACGRGKDAAQADTAGLFGQLAAAARGSSSGGNASHDPCALVSQAEAERYLGPLAHPPYRAMESDESPSEGGTMCVYRTADGHHITVRAEFENGKVAMKMVTMGQQLVGKVLPGERDKTDTLDVAWDQVQWMGPGRLFALKGDAMLEVNVAASSAGVVGASELAGKGIERFAHPLAYDGARAVRGAPAPATPRDPCSLVSDADVAAIIGGLGGPPTGSNNGSQGTCHYPLASGREVVLAVKWHDGFEDYASAMYTYRQVDSTVVQPTLHEAAGGPGGMSLEETRKKVATDPDAKKVFGAMRSMLKQLGSNVEMQGAGFETKTDTAVAGPWAQGALLSGGGFMAVKHDVEMSVELRAISFEKAKALVAKAMEKI